MSEEKISKEDLKKLNSQISYLSSKQIELIDERNHLSTSVRLGFVGIVAAFLGIIGSLYTQRDNMYTEWLFFASVSLSVLTLLLTSISTFEELHLTDKMIKELNQAIKEAKEKKSLIENDIIIPRKKYYKVCFIIGIACFALSVLSYCAICLPFF